MKPTVKVGCVNFRVNLTIGSVMLEWMCEVLTDQVNVTLMCDMRDVVGCVCTV